MKRGVLAVCLTFLIAFYLLALLAPLIAPILIKSSFASCFYVAPTKIHFRDPGETGILGSLFTTTSLKISGLPTGSSRRLPIYFFVDGYQWFCRTWRTHLFGLRDSSKKIFLLGSDGLGRDLFSRILYGSQFSLTIGLVGIVFTAGLWVVMGAVAGYFAGWMDVLVGAHGGSVSVASGSFFDPRFARAVSDSIDGIERSRCGCG